MAAMLCLKDIRIYNSSRCITGLMGLIFQRSPFIQSLTISECDFNEGDLYFMISLCPNLIEFNLDVPVPIQGVIGGDALVFSMARHCEKLQYLSLEGLESLSDNGLSGLITKFGQQLKGLQLKTCRNLTENGLDRIAECQSLKKLTLSYISSLNDRILIRIVSHTSKTLEFIQLESVSISDYGIKNVSNIGKSLQELRLYDLNLLTDISFLSQDSRGLSNLKQLMLHGSPALSNSKDVYKFSAPLLERLELVGCVSLDETVLTNMVMQFSNLKRFIYAGPHASLEFQKVYFTN